MKLKCLFGFHLWQTLGVSEYRHKTGVNEYVEKRQLVKKCTHCNKLQLPPWYDEEYRLLHPPLDRLGWPSGWLPDDFITSEKHEKPLTLIEQFDHYNREHRATNEKYPRAHAVMTFIISGIHFFLCLLGIKLIDYLLSL